VRVGNHNASEEDGTMKIHDAVKMYRSGRVILHLLDDPDTPVMVEIHNKGTATYDCAIGTGDCDGYELKPAEIEWLESHRTECEEWYDKKRII
jgi:hypothetical protein